MTTPTNQEFPQPNKKREGDEQSSDYDELVEHLRSIEGVGDEMADFVAKNWQKFVGALIVVLLGVMLVGKYRETQTLKVQEAAGYFATAQEDFKTVRSSAGDTENPALGALNSNLTRIEKSYDDGAYGRLAGLYKARAALESGDRQKALAELKQLNPKVSVRGKATPTMSPDTLIAELSELLRAKTLLSDETSRDKGRAALLKLVETAEVVSPDAALGLLRSSKTDAEREESIAAAKSLAEQKPHLRDILDRELSKFGVELS